MLREREIEGDMANKLELSDLFHIIYIHFIFIFIKIILIFIIYIIN